MKTILDDPEGFFDNGGWNFLASESDVNKKSIDYRFFIDFLSIRTKRNKKVATMMIPTKTTKLSNPRTKKVAKRRKAKKNTVPNLLRNRVLFEEDVYSRAFLK